jgi:hypothetical protein
MPAERYPPTMESFTLRHVADAPYSFFQREFLLDENLARIIEDAAEDHLCPNSTIDVAQVLSASRIITRVTITKSRIVRGRSLKWLIEEWLSKPTVVPNITLPALMFDMIPTTVGVVHRDVDGDDVVQHAVVIGTSEAIVQFQSDIVTMKCVSDAYQTVPLGKNEQIRTS